jgi:hypothetical protein
MISETLRRRLADAVVKTRARRISDREKVLLMMKIGLFDNRSE